MFQFVQLKAPMVKALDLQIKYKKLNNCIFFYFLEYFYSTHITPPSYVSE